MGMGVSVCGGYMIRGTLEVDTSGWDGRLNSRWGGGGFDRTG